MNRIIKYKFLGIMNLNFLMIINFVHTKNYEINIFKLIIMCKN